MNEPRQRVSQLFEAALELPLREQSQFLANECAGQPRILAEVKSLLDAHDEAEAESFMRQPALQIQAHQIASELAETRSGQTIGRYQLLELIGEGGMGEVYLAQDQELDRKVAIKLIKGNFKTKELLCRFSNERQILAHLNHANIAGLLDGGTTAEGVPFFVMEYVEGLPVDRYANEHQLSTTDRLKLFRTVCDAVQYAHQNLIIHRDLKPANILVTADGEPKLLDFGIAKLLVADESGAVDQTATLFRVMTPEYASPEQVKGEPVTTATDVYSLGVVLYELLTGQRPHKFSSRQPADIVQAICIREPEKPSAAVGRGEGEKGGQGESITGEEISFSPFPHRPVPPSQLRGDIDNIVLKALRKEPQRRYASVEQFSEDLRRYLEGLPVSARQDTFSYRTGKFVRRHKIGVAAAAGILLALVGGIVATSWEAHVARAERAKAERRFNDVRKLANSFMFEFHDAIQDLPGSLKARQLVVQKALEYLDSLAQEAGDDRELQGELAAAYDKIGLLTFDVAKALEIHLKARSLNETLVKAEPGNPKYQQQLAVSYSYVADLSKESGDSSGELDNNEKARALMEALVASDPANIQYRSRLAENYEEMSMTLTEIGQITKAMEYGRKALVIRGALVTAEPANAEYRFYLVVDYVLVGDALLDVGDNAGALENYRKALAIAEFLLVSDPTSARYRRHMWASYSREANALMRTGNLTVALANYRKALTFIEDLAAADPGDKGHAHGISVTDLHIGNVLAEMGQTSGALESYRKALAISENLLASDPSKAETRIDLAKIYTSLGSLLASLGDTVKARDYLRKGQEFFEEAAKSDPKGITPKKGLADTYASIGELHARIASQAKTLRDSRAEHWQEARYWYQKSLDIYQDMKSKGTLSGADANKPDELAKEIAKCDEALRRVRGQ
jgi:serine/threonine protein kinase